MIPYGISETILQDILAVAARYPALETLRLYGSRAKGNFKNYSDIDLAFTLDKSKDSDNYTGSKFMFELEGLPIIFKMDIVDLDKLTNENLKKKILDEGVILFQR